MRSAYDKIYRDVSYVISRIRHISRKLRLHVVSIVAVVIRENYAISQEVTASRLYLTSYIEIVLMYFEIVSSEKCHVTIITDLYVIRFTKHDLVETDLFYGHCHRAKLSTIAKTVNIISPYDLQCRKTEKN